MTGARFGFAGLGQMGGPMAANIAAAGFRLAVHDTAGTRERAPEKADALNSLAELATASETLFLSLPDGAATLSVARELAAMEDPAVTVVVDLSTIGPAAAGEALGILDDAGIAYVDAPVSGGRAGALAGTITVMWAGPAALLDAHRPVLDAFAGNVFHVGDRAGQGQAMKLLNNFLSATAMAATSEAVLYGLGQGLDMKTVLDVVNVSTGRNTATSDKFPNRVLTGTFDAGFQTGLLNKDVRLYIEDVRAAGTPDAVGAAVARTWQRAADTAPDSDFSRIYEFIRDKADD